MRNSKIYFLFIITILFSACGGLNEKQEKSVETALTALRKIDASTEVGINKSEYSKKVIDAKVAVANASELLPNGELKQSLQDTLQNYIDADSVIFIGGADTYIPICVGKPSTEGKNSVEIEIANIFCNPTASEIAKKYNIQMRKAKTLEPVSGAGILVKKEAISIIWNKAKENLKNASSLFR